MKDLETRLKLFVEDNTNNKEVSCKFNSRVGYTIVEKDNSETFYDLGFNYCFSNLNCVKRKDGLKIGRVFSLLRPIRWNEEYAEVYYNWLLNDSPWASAFLSKSYDKVKEEGFVLTTNISRDYLASALSATRFFTETHHGSFKDQTKTFGELLEKGVGGKEAFILATYLYPNSANHHSYILKHYVYYGHNIMPSDPSMKTLKNFYNGIYEESERFDSTPGYQTMSGIWKNDYNRESFKTYASKFMKNEDGASKNIFQVEEKYLVINRDQLVDFANFVKEGIQNAA